MDSYKASDPIVILKHLCLISVFYAAVCKVTEREERPEELTRYICEKSIVQLYKEYYIYKEFINIPNSFVIYYVAMDISLFLPSGGQHEWREG